MPPLPDDHWTRYQRGIEVLNDTDWQDRGRPSTGRREIEPRRVQEGPVLKWLRSGSTWIVKRNSLPADPPDHRIWREDPRLNARILPCIEERVQMESHLRKDYSDTHARTALLTGFHSFINPREAWTVVIRMSQACGAAVNQITVTADDQGVLTLFIIFGTIRWSDVFVDYRLIWTAVAAADNQPLAPFLHRQAEHFRGLHRINVARRQAQRQAEEVQALRAESNARWAQMGQGGREQQNREWSDRNEGHRSRSRRG